MLDFASSDLILILKAVWSIFKTWWWVLPPVLLFKPVLNLWLWQKRETKWKNRECVLLEIKIPEDVLKPIKAMEDVFASLSVIKITPGDFREKWLEGDSDLWPPLSLEIVGLGGQARFFIRTYRAYQDTVEAAIYSHYPNVEINEAEDYTKTVSQDIPDHEWNFEGRDFILKKQSCYPLRTYKEFEPMEGVKEEKRIDPIAGLLEGFSKLKSGEQVWIQILLHVSNDDWIDEGEEIRNKLVKRPGPAPKKKPMAQEAVEIMIRGMEEKKENKKELLPPEMMLTPGEREAVKRIEEKISKYGFDTSIRVMYLGKGDNFFKPHMQLPIAYLKSFDTKNLNSFGTIGETSTKIKSIFWWADKRRAFLRKRKMFRNYVMRVRPMFPRKTDKHVFNIEELASIFHFPGRTVAQAPSVERIEARKGEAPTGLPVEQ